MKGGASCVFLVLGTAALAGAACAQTTVNQPLVNPVGQPLVKLVVQEIHQSVDSTLRVAILQPMESPAVYEQAPVLFFTPASLEDLPRIAELEVNSTHTPIADISIVQHDPTGSRVSHR